MATAARATHLFHLKPLKLVCTASVASRPPGPAQSSPEDSHSAWFSFRGHVPRATLRRPGRHPFQELGGEGLTVGAVMPPGQRGGPPSRKSLEWVDTITIPCEERRVRLPTKVLMDRHSQDEWTEPFLAELLAYPEGSNDDVVAALTQLLWRSERVKAKWEAQERQGLLPVRFGRSRERMVMV